MKQGVGFSTGKIIVTGEHSVVYGCPAVVSAISKGITARVAPTKTQKTQTASAYESHILELFSQAYSVDTTGLSLFSESDLANTSGLGSSAAFAHASMQALLDFYSLSAPTDEIYRFVLRAEAFIHTNPSGIDPCAVVYRNTHFFQKKTAEQLFKKQLSLARQYTFLVINSGKATESTGQMVQQVARLHKQKNFSTVFSKMGAVSTKIATSLQDGTFSGDLLDENQAYLEEIGVVGSQAKEIIATVGRQGVHAKITGAGGVASGSGWILAFATDIQKLEAVATASGWETFTSTVQ